MNTVLLLWKAEGGRQGRTNTNTRTNLKSSVQYGTSYLNLLLRVYLSPLVLRVPLCVEGGSNSYSRSADQLTRMELNSEKGASEKVRKCVPSKSGVGHSTVLNSYVTLPITCTSCFIISSLLLPIANFKFQSALF